MKIFLIRHGETTGDIEDRYGGDYDDHLTNKGKEQSKECAFKLKNKGIKIIYHSPLARARESAEIINNELKIELKPMPDFKERNNYGIVTGMTKEEAIEKHPEAVNELAKGYNHNLADTESYEDFKKRVSNVFNLVLNKEYDNIGIILHGGPIRLIVREILGLGEIESLGHCAILELEKIGDKIDIIDYDNLILSD